MYRQRGAKKLGRECTNQHRRVAEGAAPWHGFVPTEGVEWAPKGRNAKAVAHNYKFSIQAEFGGADSVDWKLGFFAKSDVTISARAVIEESEIIVKHDVCCAWACTIFVISVDDREEWVVWLMKLFLCKVADKSRNIGSNFGSASGCNG